MYIYIYCKARKIKYKARERERGDWLQTGSPLDWLLYAGGHWQDVEAHRSLYSASAPEVSPLFGGCHTAHTSVECLQHMCTHYRHLDTKTQNTCRYVCVHICKCTAKTSSTVYVLSCVNMYDSACTRVCSMCASMSMFIAAGLLSRGTDWLSAAVQGAAS